jgi:hypothetical protein
MVKKYVMVFVCAALAALSFAKARALPSQTASARSECFQETGHRVEGEFLDYFEANGGTDAFGLPRTEQFAQDGLTVQYFQRARMELHPEREPDERIQLSLLGELLGYKKPAVSASSIIPSASPERRYYAASGHSVSYAFLEYLDSHGGVATLGYPITELQTEEGAVVQYFQKAKLTWHPENGLSNPVALGNLGDEYIIHIGLAESYLRAVSCTSTPEAALTEAPTALPTAVGLTPVASLPSMAQPTVAPTQPAPTEWNPVPTQPPVGRRTPAAAQPAVPRNPVPSQPQVKRRTPVPAQPMVPRNPPPTQGIPESSAAPSAPHSGAEHLVASTWVEYSNAGGGGLQTAYVRVLDPQGRPVRDAAVEVWVYFGSGVQSLRAPDTDSSGSSSISFHMGRSEIGYPVSVEARVFWGALTTTALTRFFPLW